MADKKEIDSPETLPSPDSCNDWKVDIVGYYGRPAVGGRWVAAMADDR
jgi:hypothetical protein